MTILDFAEFAIYARRKIVARRICFPLRRDWSKYGRPDADCVPALPKGSVVKGLSGLPEGGPRRETSVETDTAEPATPADVPHRLVRETALEEVRQAIASGTLKPGSRLTEKSICEQFGVSRTLAREIIRKLETERLVDVVPYRGLRIAILTPQVVEEIYAVRTELEVMVVRAFIGVATDDDIAALMAIHTALVAAANCRDVPGIVNLVTRFLRTMIEVSGSRVVGELLENLLARINMLRVYAMARPGQLGTSITQMDRIVAAIAARDAAEAEAAVRLYVQTAGRAALQQLAEQATPK